MVTLLRIAEWTDPRYLLKGLLSALHETVQQFQESTLTFLKKNKAEAQK